MATVGYARVSTAGQSLDVQLEKLKDCDRIYKEKRSGRTDRREELASCLDYVREGDTLVVTKLDRLGRSTRDLLNIINRLEEKGVVFKVLDQNIDTGTPAGRLMFTLLGAIAEFENDLRRERQADGIAIAKEKGVQLGRKPKLDQQAISQLREKRLQGVRIKSLMEEYGLSKATTYRLLKIENECLKESDVSL